ncbi:MAG: metallopeptidase TldD-related protein, partial [Bryobacteraceae bacterium]
EEAQVPGPPAAAAAAAGRGGALRPALFLIAAAALGQVDDPILRALGDEVARAKSLKLAGLESPYYVAASIEDLDSFTATATLGALVRASRTLVRVPQMQVRVGDYDFDNTNYVGSGFFSGSRYDLERLPLDNSYPLLRRHLWLASDQAYKGAVESIARKRAALRNVTVAEKIADFARAEPVRLIEPSRRSAVDEDGWKDRLRRLSAVLGKYPDLRTSGVELEIVQNTHYQATSEGTQVRVPEALLVVRARAWSQAPDGMMLRDAVAFHFPDITRVASDAEMGRALEALAGNVTTLAKAPIGEIYNGPAIFEGEASPQLFAQVLGRNLSLFRRPVTEPNRSLPFPASELEGRAGSRILPEWMDVVCDPTQKEWRGRPLLGHYRVDLEGTAPTPLSLVEKGVLKQFLLTRQPVRGFSGSNGRARLLGAFGAYGASFANLFVTARETVPGAELKKKLLEMISARGKAYGLILRKLDFPTSGSLDDLRRQFAGSQQQGGAGRVVSSPVLAYKVFPDGREELVRGLRFRSLGVRALRDIQAASDQPFVFEYLDSGAPLAMAGSGGLVAETAVIAPAVLIDDVELDRIEEDFPKIPIVPPPQP